MMEISEITALVISMAPTISAVVGIIVSLAVGIKRIKQANRDTLDECRKQNAEVVIKIEHVAKDNETLKRENEELKKDLRKVMAKLCHVHIEDNK